MNSTRKPLVVGVVGIIVILAVFAVGTVIMSLLRNPGTETGAISAENAKPAATALDGTWVVVQGDAPNLSSAGFTFNEILPSDRRTTSGSTTSVKGEAVIANDTLTQGKISVDMTAVATDIEKRDINVQNKIFQTKEHPEAFFEVTEPVKLGSIPEDGTIGDVTIPGELTIKGKTKKVTSDYQVLRDGEKISLSTAIEINRLDFGVETPEFVAAKIDEVGLVKVLLTLEKKQ
jgi:hypothetical protein